MSGIDIVRESTVERTPRVMQLEGIFDIPPSKRSIESWNVNFELPEKWNIGLIVGPSGSGKSTVANELFGDFISENREWGNKSILDYFPQDMSIKDIVELLSSVGFSSPPSWVRPYSVLSTGEKSRVDIAKAIAENRDTVCVDEFTSVVDRTVAQIGSAAIQKTVRKRNQRFIAVSCHYDIIDWLEPDWIYQPHTNEFYSWMYLHQRPRIVLEVKRVHYGAWKMFRKYHYLDTSLNKSARCFCAFWNDIPVAFSAVLHFPHPKRKRTKREHRTVCLPDYQGVGIGNALADYIGAMLKTLGYSYISQTSHPAMIRSRARSANWRMIAKPNRSTKSMPKGISLYDAKGRYDISLRFRATFEYCGDAIDKETALCVWS